MPAAAAASVDEVLKARDNARRIKETYEGTLGVPSELQYLGHLLTHDKDGIFTGLENLPCYGKSKVQPPPPPEPTRGTNRQRRHNRHHHQHDAGTCGPWPSGKSLIGAQELVALAQDSTGVQPTERDGAQRSHPISQQQPLPPMPIAEPSGDKELHTAAAVLMDPLRWGSYGGIAQSIQNQHQRRRQHHHSHHSQQSESPPASPMSSCDPMRTSHDSQQGGGNTRTQHPNLPAERAAVPLHHQQHPPLWQSQSQPSLQLGWSCPAGGGGGASVGDGGATMMSLDSWANGCGLEAGSASGSECNDSGCGSGSEAEAEAGRKHRMARQRLLAAADLSPQDWARIGPPQDAADQARFVARGYSIQVDWEPHSMTAKRVARPDIFHITPEEAHRRQMEADEATLALQAQRRAEQQAAEYAAEQERLARMSQRGPLYNSFGVLHGERSASAVRPRYLDWHPAGVGGLQPLQHHLSMNGRAGGGGSGSGGASSPVASRCVSAQRTRPEALAAGHRHSAGGYAAGGAGGVLRAAAAAAAAPPAGPSSPRRAHSEMPTTTTAVPDGFVYEDLSEDAAGEAADGLGPCPAYGTRPPQRRHHSALAGPRGNFAPPLRPAGVTDAHYAQILRQQRKWLNAPVQPPRPLSAAPQPTPPSKFYVRPQSSRPAPEGTAAPVPSRMGAAAQAASAAAAQRPGSALRTVITERCVSQQHHSSSWGPSARPQSPGNAAVARPWSGQSREGAGGAGAGAGGVGSRPPSAGAGAGGSRAARRVSGEAEAGGRPRSAASGSAGQRSRPASAARQSQPHTPRELVVFGETVPPEGRAGPGEGEGYMPRKFAMHGDMVGVMLEGYASREVVGAKSPRS